MSFARWVQCSAFRGAELWEIKHFFFSNGIAAEARQIARDDNSNFVVVNFADKTYADKLWAIRLTAKFNGHEIFVRKFVPKVPGQSPNTIQQ
jgi:hypothetical protein